MFENEIKFMEGLLSVEAKVAKAQRYIKETYGVDSEWDAENLQLHMKSDGTAEAIDLAAAKSYLDEELDPQFVETLFD